MRLNDFQGELPTLWVGDPQHADLPVDRRFKDVLERTRGMATENKLALLNLAARCLEPDELYLEIGAYRGTSIIGASLGAHDRRFVTIDNFSEFGGIREECLANLDEWGCGNVTLLSADAWAVLADPPFHRPVGVYFYDGRHRFVDQWAAFEKAERLLADEALVIVDDTGFRQVAAANRTYVRHRPQYERIAAFTSPWVEEPRWWNGLELYAFRRAAAGASGGPPAVERAEYLAKAAYHDVVRRFAGPVKGRVLQAARRRHA